MPLPQVLDDIVLEAIGRRRRIDAASAPSGGPAGNAVLIAWTGLLLLVLILAELITLLDVRGLIGWHVGIGVLLIPPALLKTGATGWRIARYYIGHRDYRSAGPPPLLLRILGPLVIAATLALLASGVVLVAVGDDTGQRTLFTALGQRVDLVTVHQALFIAFGVVTGLHVLGRLVRALALAGGRSAHRIGGTGPVPGTGRRVLALGLTVVAAVTAMVLLLPLADGWHSEGPPPGFPAPGAHSAR